MTKKVEELAVQLNDIETDAVSGGAVLGDDTVATQDWDKVMALGCCTQGCSPGCDVYPDMVG